MSSMKRAFPIYLWLAAFLLLLAAFLTGLWLLKEETAPAASLPDFSLLLRAESYSGMIPMLETALYASLLCLVLGYPAGCILALWRRRAVFVSWMMALLFLWGMALLFGQRLIPMFPQGFAASFLAAISLSAAPYEAIAVILLPLMILCTCSFSKAVDPALARAARGLGASRFRAFLMHTFPRTLEGVPAGFAMVFIPALGLALISRQAPGTAFLLAVPVSAAIVILTALIIIVCLFILKKARRISPC